MDTREETINTKAIIDLVTLELKRFAPDTTLELEVFAYRIVTRILDAAYAHKLRIEHPERYEQAVAEVAPVDGKLCIIACVRCGTIMSGPINGQKTCSKADNKACHSEVTKMKHRMDMAARRLRKNPEIKMRMGNKFGNDLPFLKSIGYEKAVSFKVQ